MANEPGNKGPGSSSSSADSYIGSFISLISKYEIRYEGVLCYINTQDSTIRLKNVRSYGTEGRKKDSPQIPPSDKVFDYVMFRGSDIKDLQVKSSPPQTEEHIHYDPAIIQSQYASGSSSSPVSASVDVASSESSRHQDTPALTSRIHPHALSSYQSAAQVGPSAHSQTAQLAGVPYFATPLYGQGNGTSIGVSHAPQHPVPVRPTTVSFPSMMQNSLQAPEFKAAECASLVPTLVASTSVHPKLSPPVTPEQYSSSPIDMPSTLSLNSSISSHSTSLASNRLTMPSFSASHQDINTKEALTVGKVVSGQASGLPFQSSQLSAPVPLMVPPQTLLTQTQVGQASLSVPCSLQNSTDMGARTLSLAISTPILQMPLLPLPPSAQKLPNSTMQYTEEFDFIAMNEKFRKDEVWGYLGKAKQNDKMGWTKDDTVDQKMGDHEVNIPDNDATPAYNKDEFFDTISCNAHTRGVRYGQHRWFERMQRDTETFGTSHHRPQGGFDGYGAGRGVNYRGSYNLGRGYGYRGRGHGRNRNM